MVSTSLLIFEGRLAIIYPFSSKLTSSNPIDLHSDTKNLAKSNWDFVLGQVEDNSLDVVGNLIYFKNFSATGIIFILLYIGI